MAAEAQSVGSRTEREAEPSDGVRTFRRPTSKVLQVVPRKLRVDIGQPIEQKLAENARKRFGARENRSEITPRAFRNALSFDRSEIGGKREE